MAFPAFTVLELGAVGLALFMANPAPLDPFAYLFSVVVETVQGEGRSRVA